jgi:hypothetical protein
MPVFETLRKQREDKSNRWLERFLLVCRLESVSRCPARHPGPGDFLSLIEATAPGIAKEISNFLKCRSLKA